MSAGPTEAAEFNRALVLGQTVRLEMDAQEKDAQGRMLAYVYVGDLMVNAELVANGYAAVAITPPNVMHGEILQNLQRQARLLKVGRWRDSPYVGREPGRGAPPKQSASAADPKTAPPRRFGTVDRPGAEPHDAWTCPISHPVKGAVNPSNSGERLYHMPGRRSVREDPARPLLRQWRRGARGRQPPRPALRRRLSPRAAGSPRPAPAASRRSPRPATAGGWS
jgi:hypothetical protein